MRCRLPPTIMLPPRTILSQLRTWWTPSETGPSRSSRPISSNLVTLSRWLRAMASKRLSNPLSSPEVQTSNPRQVCPPLPQGQTTSEAEVEMVPTNQAKWGPQVPRQSDLQVLTRITAVNCHQVLHLQSIVLNTVSITYIKKEGKQTQRAFDFKCST